MLFSTEPVRNDSSGSKIEISTFMMKNVRDKKSNDDFFPKWNSTPSEKIAQMRRKRERLLRRLGNYPTFYKLISKFSEKSRELCC